MDVDTILLSIVFTLAAGTAVTVTTSGVSVTEFWFARICYVVAALSLLIYYAQWLSISSKDPRATKARRVISAVLVLLLSVGGLTLGTTWVGWRENSAAAQAQSQSQLTARAHRTHEVVLQLSNFHSDAMELLMAQVGRDQAFLWNEKRKRLENDATMWVEKNLGIAARNRLLDMTGFTSNDHALVTDTDRREQLIWLDKFARNVRALMQEEAIATASPL